jgi:translocator protein
MSYLTRLVIFLGLNSGALAIGSYFTGPGASSDWYENLNKAPWTPPGFVFGLAWSVIMICFSFFMANLTGNRRVIPLNIFITVYALQWIFNVLWNPLFFNFQLPVIALADIIILTIIVTWFLYAGFRFSFSNGFLVLPYFIWLLIATSLNAYIVLNN